MVFCLHGYAPDACIDPRGQERATDPLAVMTVVKLPCGYWKSNQDPLEEQSMLLTTESSLQPLTDTLSLHNLKLLLFISISLENYYHLLFLTLLFLTLAFLILLSDLFLNVPFGSHDIQCLILVDTWVF